VVLKFSAYALYMQRFGQKDWHVKAGLALNAMCVIGTWIGIWIGWQQLSLTRGGGQSAVTAEHGSGGGGMNSLPLYVASASTLVAACVMFAIIRRRKNLKLAIHSAFYGTGRGADIDVTEKLRSYTLDDRLCVTVSLWAFSGIDPYPNEWKHLKIDYSYGSVRRTITRNEGIALRLPEDDVYREATGS